MAEAERIEPKLEQPKVEVEAKVEPKVEPKVEAKVEPEAKVEVEAKPDAWKDKRLAQTTARNHELKAQLDAKEAELTALKAGKVEAKVEPAAASEEEVQAQVNSRLAIASWNKTCNDIAQAGTLAHPDFTAKVKDTVEKLVGADPTRGQAYVNLVNAANETDSSKAHEILYTLVSDPNEFDRVLGLSPVKMAVEMTRMLGSDGQVISRAPKPIKPIGSRGIAHEAIEPDDPDRSDNLDTKKWMERREKQVAERAKMH